MDLDPQKMQQARSARPIKVFAAQRAEEAVAQEEEIEELQKKLEKKKLLLEVLTEVNNLMSRGWDFENFFIEIGRLLRNKLQIRFTHLWLRDEADYAMLRLVTPDEISSPRRISVNKGIVGRSIREGRAICIPDVTQDSDYVKIHEETKSEYSVPLICDNKVIGAINIETDTYQTFKDKGPVIEAIAENLSYSVKVAYLYKSEKQFHHLIEKMNEGVWVGDVDEKTTYTNPALQKMLGYSKEEFLKMQSYDLFDEESQKIVRPEVKKRQRGISSHYEATLLTKDGEHIPIMVHAVPFVGGATMATFTDLRPLKITEKKLVRAERFLASITQHCPEAIVGLDENGVIQTWNMSAERMFGYKDSEVVGKSIELIIPPDRIAAGELAQLLHDTKTKGFVRNFETIRMHKNGAPLNVSVTGSAIRDNQGIIMGISVLYRDITAQKKWERELQDRFEKMQDAYREMGKQRRYLDYMTDMINMASSTSFTTKQLAVFIVNAMIIIAKVDAVTLRLLDSRSGKLILISQSGLSEDWWSKKAISFAGSLLEAASTHGHPLKILDVLNEPRYKSPSLAQKNNLRSALVIPLQIKGEVLGSLTLYLSQKSSLSLLDEEFITVFAKQAAIALKLASR